MEQDIPQRFWNRYWWRAAPPGGSLQGDWINVFLGDPDNGGWPLCSVTPEFVTGVDKGLLMIALRRWEKKRVPFEGRPPE